MATQAAAMAARTPPPVPSTDAAANCADPANVVADMTTGATLPIPAASASTPNERPKTNALAAIGATARAPSR